MSIIAKNTEKTTKKPFELAFFLENADGSEFLDYDLPFPNYHYKTHQGHLVVMWKLDGYFGTKKNQDYLNDIIARFIFTFQDNKAKRSKVYIKRDSVHQEEHINSLKQFQGLKSIERAKKVARRANLTGTKDQTFYALKFHAEELIKESGVCSYDDLFNFALSNFEDKEFSLLRGKCRNIINWYAERDFKIGRVSQKYKDLKSYHEETRVTRTDRMIKINKERAELKKRLVANAITGLFSDNYKKKNGTWNATAIAKDIGIKRETVSKYLKELSK